MSHDPDGCYFCEHGDPHPPWADLPAIVKVTQRAPADYWPGGCMCDFEGNTVTGCTHES